jgi:hypothetical protein
MVEEVETVVDSQVFGEFSAALERRRLEVNTRNIDHLWNLCSEFDFHELFAALETFDAPPPHADVSLIEDESCRRVHDVEEKNLQLECHVYFMQQAVSDLGMAAENTGQKYEINAFLQAQRQEIGALRQRQEQEKEALEKGHDELVARFARAHAQSRSEDSIKRILRETRTLRK